MSLSVKTIEIVKATAVPVKENSEAITKRMYEILFSDFPEVESIFEGSDPAQHKKLAAAVSAYAANIDNLGVLTKAIEKMAATHILKKVQPEYYPMVGLSILKAIKDVLGDAATEEVLEAWKEAYFFLADILITREKELYGQA